MAETPVCEHDWEAYRSVCTYSNGDIQRAYTCQGCGQNRVTINGVEITEEEALKIEEGIQSGRLATFWTLEQI